MTTNNQLTSWPPAKILAAIDFSPISAQVLNYAAALARQFGAHVFLTHVVTGMNDSATSGRELSASPETREDAERKISDILKSGQMSGVQNTVLLEEGYFLETLETLVRKYEIGLVLTGTHGRKHTAGESHEPWAELIFRNVDCPVMTVGPACEGGKSREVKWKSILFATDFGRASDHTAPYVCSLAREFGAQLTVLNVVEGTESYSEKEWVMLQQTTRIRLLESLPSGMDQHCRLEYLVRRGDSPQEILNVARSNKVDLIVMGARAGRNYTTHLPEAAAYTVAAGAPCPVLTVREY